MDRLGPQLELMDTNWRDPTPVDKQVFCALYALGHSPSTYDAIGQQFGLSPTNVSRILSRFCNAIWAHFGAPSAPEPVFVAAWDEASLSATMAEFEAFRGLPNCVGAIDCTHIEHTQPLSVEDPSGYCDRHGWYLTILQAICDMKTGFMNIDIGMPGATNDACIFEASDWFKRAVVGQMLQEPIREVCGRKIQPNIIGDAAYPLSSFCFRI